MATDQAALAFGERLLSLLDTGSYTTSYKYALLLSLVDAVLENTSSTGEPPRTLSGAELGRRVFELYWSQARPFSDQGPLRQSAQRDIVVKIAELRRQIGVGEHSSVERVRQSHRPQLESLESEVVATVIRYPIPLLQRFGTGRGAIEQRFIYDYGWTHGVSTGRVHRPDFDDRLILVGDAGRHLSALSGLIRPVVQREWLSHVVRRNEDQLDDLRVESFLFGATRVDLTPVRRPLLDLQQGMCFYCGEGRGPWEVDHFLPWSRWPDDRLDNLVVAHRACNNDKRSALAAVPHLRRWCSRAASDGGVDEVAAATGWPRRPDATMAAARALYLHQPEGAMAWRARGVVEPLRRSDVVRALGDPVLRAVAEEGGRYRHEGADGDESSATDFGTK